MSNLKEFNAKELLDLFMHLDKIHAGKENLFIPLSIAMFPGVAASWGKVPFYGVVAFGVISVLIYSYHILVTRRFGQFQANIFEEISRLQKSEGCDLFQSQLYRLFGPDSKREKKFDMSITIPRLRKWFLAVIIFSWLVIFFIRYDGVN